MLATQKKTTGHNLETQNLQPLNAPLYCLFCLFCFVINLCRKKDKKGNITSKNL